MVESVAERNQGGRSPLPDAGLRPSRVCRDLRPPASSDRGEWLVEGCDRHLQLFVVRRELVEIFRASPRTRDPRRPAGQSTGAGLLLSGDPALVCIRSATTMRSRPDADDRRDACPGGEGRAEFMLPASCGCLANFSVSFEQDPRSSHGCVRRLRNVL
jgi:hypothetical protein